MPLPLPLLLPLAYPALRLPLPPLMHAGCHPGAWLQVACQSLGPRSKGGRILGVDLQPTQLPPKFCDDRWVGGWQSRRRKA